MTKIRYFKPVASNANSNIAFSFNFPPQERYLDLGGLFQNLRQSSNDLLAHTLPKNPLQADFYNVLQVFRQLPVNLKGLIFSDNCLNRFTDYQVELLLRNLSRLTELETIDFSGVSNESITHSPLAQRVRCHLHAIILAVPPSVKTLNIDGWSVQYNTDLWCAILQDIRDSKIETLILTKNIPDMKLSHIFNHLETIITENRLYSEDEDDLISPRLYS
jgi:hypothetical protein